MAVVVVVVIVNGWSLSSERDPLIVNVEPEAEPGLV